MKTTYDFNNEDDYYELEKDYDYKNKKKLDFLTKQLNLYFQNPKDKNNYYNLNYKE